MAKINIEIPIANFEIIRDRIALILAEEIDNQAVLTYDADLEAVEVFLERTKAFDKTEVPCINVSLATGNFSNKHQGYQDGVYTFNIDIYTNAQSTDAEDGDVLSTLSNHKLLRICRYILEDPQYKTLDFAPGFIGNTMCTEINIANAERMDEFNHIMSRISFSVKSFENNALKIANAIDGYKTTLKIIESNSGYLYVGGNE
jgi:hypothetical protein